MRIIVYIKNGNLSTGFISLKKAHVQAYWNGLIESIEVYTSDKQYVESYYGHGLEILMTSLEPMQDTHGDTIYYLAKRWIKEKE